MNLNGTEYSLVNLSESEWNCTKLSQFVWDCKNLNESEQIWVRLGGCGWDWVNLGGNERIWMNLNEPKWIWASISETITSIWVWVRLSESVCIRRKTPSKTGETPPFPPISYPALAGLIGTSRWAQDDSSLSMIVQGFKWVEILYYELLCLLSTRIRIAFSRQQITWDVASWAVKRDIRRSVLQEHTYNMIECQYTITKNWKFQHP